jgi:hypothetical protein
MTVIRFALDTTFDLPSKDAILVPGRLFGEVWLHLLKAYGL